VTRECSALLPQGEALDQAARDLVLRRVTAGRQLSDAAKRRSSVADSEARPEWLGETVAHIESLSKGDWNNPRLSAPTRGG
jgi:hypothetical protein